MAKFREEYIKNSHKPLILWPSSGESYREKVLFSTLCMYVLICSIRGFCGKHASFLEFRFL